MKGSQNALKGWEEKGTVTQKNRHYRLWIELKKSVGLQATEKSKLLRS